MKSTSITGVGNDYIVTIVSLFHLVFGQHVPFSEREFVKSQIVPTCTSGKDLAKKLRKLGWKVNL